ncbi:MAG: hypothetical protein GC129_00480 [Proteobacteria bacterium]|nr:hypothetical protein [Pseudomonadota bacterium]
MRVNEMPTWPVKLRGVTFRPGDLPGELDLPELPFFGVVESEKHLMAIRMASSDWDALVEHMLGPTREDVRLHTGHWWTRQPVRNDQGDFWYVNAGEVFTATDDRKLRLKQACWVWTGAAVTPTKKIANPVYNHVGTFERGSYYPLVLPTGLLEGLAVKDGAR